MDKIALKLSVIVPVYNTGLYLRKCLDSILAQTLTDFELILIDDGSTDQSPAICEQYAKADGRIRVIHQKNSGEGPAKKSGVNLARGEYILFVDSDDWIETEALAMMYNAAADNDCDLVICDWKTHDVQANRIVAHDQSKFLKAHYLYDKSKIQELILPILVLEQIPGYLWNKIYKTSILKQCQLIRVSGLPNNDDWVWNCEYFSKIKRMMYVNKCLCNYAIRESNSIMRRYRDYFSVTLELHKFRVAYLHEFNLEDRNDVRLGVINRFMNMALYAAFNYEFLFSHTTLREKLQRISVVVNNGEVRRHLKERQQAASFALESTYYVAEPGMLCSVKWFLFELRIPLLIYGFVKGFEMTRRVFRGKRDIRDAERSY